MAFKVVQELKFEKVDYSYDRNSDVLDISFGPPVPAVAMQIEDWLGIRMKFEPPYLQGMTIVGFRRIFEKINRYIEKELPERMRRLANVSLQMSISYDDQTDALILRWEERPSSWRRLMNRLFGHNGRKPSVFETLSRDPHNSLRNVYVEKILPSKEIVGVKILEFTKSGPSAVEAIFGALIDTIFDPTVEHGENAHLITNTLIQRFDWTRFAKLAAP